MVGGKQQVDIVWMEQMNRTKCSQELKSVVTELISEKGRQNVEKTGGGGGEGQLGTWDKLFSHSWPCYLTARTRHTSVHLCWSWARATFSNGNWGEVCSSMSLSLCFASHLHTKYRARITVRTGDWFWCQAAYNVSNATFKIIQTDSSFCITSIVPDCKSLFRFSKITPC